MTCVSKARSRTNSHRDADRRRANLDREILFQFFEAAPAPTAHDPWEGQIGEPGPHLEKIFLKSWRGDVQKFALLSTLLRWPAEPINNLVSRE